MQTATYGLQFERNDGAYQLSDPAVPTMMSVGDLTDLVAEQLRFPKRDIDGKPLTYSMLRGDSEVAKGTTVGDAVTDGDTLTICREYRNAGTPRR